MKKLILLSLVIAGCSSPDIPCQPNLPCTQNDLQYVEYNPPTDPQPEPTHYVPVMPDKPIIYVTTGNSQVTIEWSDCPNATSYNVYKNGVMVGSGISPYTMSGLTNDTTYTFEVSSVNADGEIMSDPVDAMSGIIDNLDGTIFIVTLNQTWLKCELSDYSGNINYNLLTGNCEGVPLQTIYCQTDRDLGTGLTPCDNGTILTSGINNAYQACNNITLSGKIWRVPAYSELIKLNKYYLSSKFNGLMKDFHWASDSFFVYGGYRLYNISNNTFTTPGNANTLFRPVLCVAN